MLKFIWLIVAVLLLAVEGMAPGLICLWFAFGAVVAFIFSLFEASLLVQIIAFFVSSVLFLLCLRPWAAKFINGKKMAHTNADSVIGKECIVTTEINNIAGQGQVKVNGSVWSAKSTSDNIIISVGEKVIAKRIEGAKLIVDFATMKEENTND